MRTQLNRGLSRRVMYIENKNGLIDGARGRIGWVGFSKTGQSVYYRGRMLQKSRGISGNFFDAASGDEYWVSGVKQRGSNGHPADQGVGIEIDPDALDAYRSIRAG